MPKKDIAYWIEQASKVTETTNPLRIPYHVAINEAVDCANFLDEYWASGEGRPGMDVTKNRLPKSTSEDIRGIVRALQQTQTELLLMVDPQVVSHGERSRFLIDEIESALEFTLDDGIEEPEDLKLEQVKLFHSQNGQRTAALAQSLLSYGTLAQGLKDRIVEADESFDPALIDEALALASTLQEAPESPQDNEQIRTTRTLRNRLLRLLQQRVGDVRKAAARVFRKHDEIYRKVTSAHERRRRAEARRASKMALLSRAAVTMVHGFPVLLATAPRGATVGP